MLELTPYGHTEPPVPAITMDVSLETVEDGERLYSANCRFCHGMNAVAGATYTYTLKITNNGPGASTGSTVTDTLPSGWTYVYALTLSSNERGWLQIDDADPR